MMQVVCQWCGHRYTMKREAVANALAVAVAAREKHHIEYCPKCRKVLKIQVADLKRHLPPGAPLPGAPKPEGAAEEKPKAE